MAVSLAEALQAPRTGVQYSLTGLAPGGVRPEPWIPTPVGRVGLPGFAGPGPSGPATPAQANALAPMFSGGLIPLRQFLTRPTGAPSFGPSPAAQATPSPMRPQLGPPSFTPTPSLVQAGAGALFPGLSGDLSGAALGALPGVAGLLAGFLGGAKAVPIGSAAGSALKSGVQIAQAPTAPGGYAGLAAPLASLMGADPAVTRGLGTLASFAPTTAITPALTAAFKAGNPVIAGETLSAAQSGVSHVLPAASFANALGGLAAGLVTDNPYASIGGTLAGIGANLLLPGVGVVAAPMLSGILDTIMGKASPYQMARQKAGYEASVVLPDVLDRVIMAGTPEEMGQALSLLGSEATTFRWDPARGITGGYEIESQLGPLNQQLLAIVKAKEAAFAGQASPDIVQKLAALGTAAKSRVQGRWTGRTTEALAGNIASGQATSDTFAQDYAKQQAVQSLVSRVPEMTPAQARAMVEAQFAAAPSPAVAALTRSIMQDQGIPEPEARTQAEQRLTAQAANVY